MSELLQLAVLEGLLASKHRTQDAEAADYFFVPVFGQCIAERGPDDSPAMNMASGPRSCSSCLCTGLALMLLPSAEASP